MQSILWRRLDIPGHEIATLSDLDDGCLLAGTAVFLYRRQPCRLDYEVRCDSQWQTRSVEVNGLVGGDVVDIRIAVSDDRGWEINGTPSSVVQGCIDIDLGFSPSTNLLPIRRLDLEVGAEAEVRAAWLPFPNLTIEHLPQKYRRESEHTYRYQSAGGRFVRMLEVNDKGFVVDYPGFWKLESP